MMTNTRKFAILAVVCALLMPAEAVRVTSEQAAVAARNWLRGGYGLERRMGTAIESVRTLAGTNGAVCHVAAVEGGGFVVLGSDTDDSPVIAVSAQGRVDPDERNPLWALLRQDMAARARARAEKRTAAGVRWAKLLGRDLAQDSSPASRKLLSASNGRATIADVRVDALVKSAWSQTDFRNFGYVSDDVVCYNYYTPNHWPCGCVATAGAQVMRYHNHPTASVAAGTYDCKVAESPTPLTMKGGTYDWKVMTLVPANGCSAESREAIGKLTYDVGVSVGMSYGGEGSNAAGYLLTKRFVDRFQYANAASVIFDKKLQCPYSLDRLKAVVIPNLDAGLPVVLGISGAGGHVVVGDGYGYSDGEFFVHINLGWANLDDGNVWYRPPDIDNYTSIDSIVYNVYPTGEAGISIVSGRILNSGGLPVKGATVRALVGGRQVSAVTSDGKGIYALKVSPGMCRIEAEKDGLVAGRNITVAACVSPRIEDSGIYWDDVKPQIGNVCDNDLTLEVSGDPDPGPQDEMDLAVGGPGLKWTTGEDYPWTISIGDFTPGGTCLRSDESVTNKYGASSWLKTTVTGPVELGFRYAKTLYRCSFTVECDGVTLYRDEEGAYRSDLKLAMVNVPAGEHEIVFRFTYNGGYYPDFNGIWLDEVSIDRYAHAPAFSPATTASETTSLTFTDSLQVTLAADSGATIHYTTDGTTPDTSSPVYRAPIVLTQTTLLRAIAERPGKEPSPVAEALYRLAKPVGPGEWTADVEAVRAAAATGGNLVAVLYADLATCWYSQQFDLQAGDAEFLAWAKANGVYLVSADQSRYPWAKAALDWFSSAHRGLTYLPTIVFFNAWALDECIGEGVFRNGETVNGNVYLSTVASLEKCFASFLTERPAPAPETYAITYDLDGGANASANPESYSADDLPITLAAPTRKGYDFTGWLPSGEIAVGTTGDLAFTATWKKQEEPELPTQSEEMDRAVGGPGLQWTTGANYPWTISTDDFTPGGVCLRSDGSVTNKNGNSSWLKTTVTGPVELWFRYAKTLYLCPFTVECDGKTLYRDEEEGWRTAWRTEMVNVPAGKHKIVFRFTYKGGVYLDFNGIWLDEVSFDRYAHAPTFSPATTASETTSLTFTGSQQVTLAADSGATIHYTTDGSTPDTSSPVYRDPIVLRQTTLLRAIAVKPGKEPSPVAEALYRLAKPVGPGEWTADVEAVRAAAATNGNMIAVLYADVGRCSFSRQLDLQAGSAEFLAWAKANGVYLVSADQSRYPWAKAALDWFYAAHSGPTYWPTIVFFNAWAPDVGIGEGVFRNGEVVNGHVYQSTVTSLEECFASFLSDRPGPSVDPEEPPAEPEDPPDEPEDPPVDPEDPPVDPEDPPVDPEDPPVDPEDPVPVESNVVVFVIGEKGVHIGGGALTQFVEKASAAVAPEVEAKPGYQFTQWDTPFDCVESNLTVKAEYETVRYAIAYRELKGASNPNPTTYTVEDEIVFSALADVEGFQFKGWTPASIAKGTTGELVVTALWEEIVVPEPEPEDYVYELVTKGRMEPLALDLEGLFGDEAAKMKSVAVKGLPSGLAYKDGAVSGTPKKSGVFVATVTLTTTAGKKLDAALTFVVRAAGEHVVVASCDAAMGSVKGQGVYARGKKVTLKATASKGCVFAGWYRGEERVSGLASYSFAMPEGDVALSAGFVTVEEDRAAIAAHIDALGVDFDADVLRDEATVVAGVYLEWPVAVEALSDTTVKVSGLPSGLKFTAKDIVDRKTKLVTVQANTIYGIPTAASKPGKPSTVKIAVTTAGKTKQEFVLALTVKPLPTWAVGTFNGGSEIGQASLTVAANGKLSGKLLMGGATWKLSSTGFDGYFEETDETSAMLFAVMRATSGQQYFDLCVVVIPEGMAGYVGEDLDTLLFEAVIADWKSGDLKATGAKIAKSSANPFYCTTDGDQPGQVTLAFSANGTVKVSGRFLVGMKGDKPVYAQASGASVLCPMGDVDGCPIFRVYIYLPAKGAFDGCAGVLDLVWDGETLKLDLSAP